MRAREPDESGVIEQDGVRIGYEVFGTGQPTIVLLPTWTIIHSRFWKAQVPYLSRWFRVITFDGAGNGRSDRPLDPHAYSIEARAGAALGVFDATGTERAIVVGLSAGAQLALWLAAQSPERVLGAVFIGPAVGLGRSAAHQHRAPALARFDERCESSEGWYKYNRYYWTEHYEEFLWFFFEQCFSEPHSTKQIEDCVGWGLETTPQVLLADRAGRHPAATEYRELCARVHCPTLVIHGDEDRVTAFEHGQALAAATHGTLVRMEGSGHIPLARDPVKVNLLLREFAERLAPDPAGPRRLELPTDSRPPVATGVRTEPANHGAAAVGTEASETEPQPSVEPLAAEPVRWRRARNRSRRALYISSPIGLGHALRDVAVARELRRLVPGLEIDWLAQHPVTRVLEDAGERIHPASGLLCNESSHIESESAEHDLHAFQAIRRMDEILVANFMVFHDLVREQPYDLWIGDEAWELDYYLHENPELKRSAYVWLTDFVGWLPMPDGGDREAFLTADYNLEMIEHIARYPRVRDRALFVGEPADIVPERFGPGLPPIRDWVEEHFEFPGYITGFAPDSLGDREALRASLGYSPDEKVCIVTVGGSGVGAHLLRRIIDSVEEARRRVPELRMIAVAGPRIDPASLPRRAGLEVRPYVHHLYRHLAACDLAIVQGGLTTAMELTASRRPFIYFPLRHHFEQSLHVHHRLQRYGAGRRMEYDDATPESIADAIAAEIGRPVEYRTVPADGARRAAERIAELL